MLVSHSKHRLPPGKQNSILSGYSVPPGAIMEPLEAFPPSAGQPLPGTGH